MTSHQDILRECVEALRFAHRWIEETCDNAKEQGTSVDTLASGKPAALRPIKAALRHAEAALAAEQKERTS